MLAQRSLALTSAYLSGTVVLTASTILGPIGQVHSHRHTQVSTALACTPHLVNFILSFRTAGQEGEGQD